MASAFSIRITDSFVDVDDDAEVGVGPVVGVDSSLEDTITKRFPIKYAGFIQEINGDIDPTGRTDLLKILDDAKINGHIDSTDTAKNFQQNAIISINYDAVTVHLLCNADYNADDTEESRLQLVVPLHMLASIGIVRDEEQNIIAMRIGAIDGATSAAVDIFDLAVLYTRTSEIADQIYDHLAVCFQFVYRESLSHSKTVHGQNESIEKFITVLSSCSSTTSHVTDHSGFEARKQPCLTASTNTSDSIKNTMDLINDYITMVGAAGIIAQSSIRLCRDIWAMGLIERERIRPSKPTICVPHTGVIAEPNHNTIHKYCINLKEGVREALKQHCPTASTNTSDMAKGWCGRDHCSILVPTRPRQCHDYTRLCHDCHGIYLGQRDLSKEGGSGQAIQQFAFRTPA